MEVSTGKIHFLLHLFLKTHFQDSDATQRGICEPLKAINQAIKLVRQSKELGIVFSVTLEVVNFMKGKDYATLKIKDLLKLEAYKDNSRDNHLLYHIMRKVVEVKPQFKGLPGSLVESIAEMGRSNMEEAKKGLNTMEITCR